MPLVGSMGNAPAGGPGGQPAKNEFIRIETPAEAYPETYFADSSLGLDLYFNKGINCLVIIINQNKFELNFLHFKNLTCHHDVLI